MFRRTPGLLVLIILGVLAHGIATWSSANQLIVAIVLGFVMVNLSGIPPWVETGVNVYKLLLEAGIVLMGARVLLAEVIASGLQLVALVLFILLFTIAITEAMSRRLFDVDSKLGSLLAGGAGICGVSAVIAIAGGVRANEEEIAYAVATILVFDAITLVAYPFIGGLLGLPDQVYGVWAGVSMFSTGPVAAAGFAYSEAAGQWATLTKLTRNVFLGFVAVAYSIWYARSQGPSETNSSVIRFLWNSFPKFVIGFLGMMIIASAGFLTAEQIVALKHAYGWLFTFAFVGLGMNIRIAEMRQTGMRPVLIVLLGLIATSTLSLTLATITFA